MRAKVNPTTFFTPEMIEHIREQYRAGVPAHEIARRLGCGKTMMANKMLELGLTKKGRSASLKLPTLGANWE